MQNKKVIIYENQSIYNNIKENVEEAVWPIIRDFKSSVVFLRHSSSFMEVCTSYVSIFPIRCLSSQHLIKIISLGCHRLHYQEGSYVHRGGKLCFSPFGGIILNGCNKNLRKINKKYNK